jgi:hypothetical protein
MASNKHPPMTEPQYGLPTDGGARGPSGSQYGDAVGPIGSANPPMTEPQYGLPTDGGAGGPSGSQYGDAVGPIGSANPPMTEPQYGLPTDEVQGDRVGRPQLLEALARHALSISGAEYFLLALIKRTNK